MINMLGMNVVQTQDQKPPFEVQLEEVGVSRLKTLVNITRKNKKYRFIVTTDIRVNLQAHIKGVHMSRLVESATEVFADETRKGAVSMTKLAETVLNTLYDKFSFNKGTIKMEFDFAHEVITPVSKRRSIEVYPIQIKSSRTGDDFLHEISVTSLGNTACPHALAEANGERTHVQRAIAKLTIKGKINELPLFEDMIDVLETSFSSPTFSVLKTPDEAWVVKNMFENPLFCEDVCRVLLYKANENIENNNVNIYAEVRAEESIHKHDVVATGSIIKFES